MTTLISEAVLKELVRYHYSKFSQPGRKLRMILSEADIVSYRALEEVLYPDGMPWRSEEHRFRVAKAFASPLYSDAAKEYFAAGHLGNSSVLSSADQFLTEATIFYSSTNSRFPLFSLAYFAALMGSAHLSERIILAAVEKMAIFEGEQALELIPDTMITSEVIGRWLHRTSWAVNNCRLVAALRVKQAHPEYEGFPDEWALKVFLREIQ